VIVKSDQMKTLQLALSVFQQENTTQWTLLMAATTFVTAPVVLLFVFAQRWLRPGLRRLRHQRLKSPPACVCTVRDATRFVA